MTAIASSNQMSTATPAAMPTLAPPGTAPFQEATPAQVRQWLQRGEAVLIDVREPDEFAREHIAGANLLPLSRFDPAQVRAKAKPEQRIVMQCRSGRRSADACRMAAPLAASGVQIFSLVGGIEAWKKENLPVEVNTAVSGISVMRQVQLVIGLCVLTGSVLAWFVDPRFLAIPAFFGAGLTFAGASGTCALATMIGWMPWNRAGKGGASCATGSCG
jgi:rhodanese-related sulfurtransferase